MLLDLRVVLHYTRIFFSAARIQRRCWRTLRGKLKKSKSALRRLLKQRLQEIGPIMLASNSALKTSRYFGKSFVRYHVLQCIYLFIFSTGLAG